MPQGCPHSAISGTGIARYVLNANASPPSLPPSLLPPSAETDFPKGAGESSSFDEDSSDALSPDQLLAHDSPLGPAALPSPPDALACAGNPSPPQVSLLSPASLHARPPPGSVMERRGPKIRFLEQNGQ